MRFAPALVALFTLPAACHGGSEASSHNPTDPVPLGAEGPAPSTTWQWQLRGTVNVSYDVEVYDIDLFDNDADFIAALRSAGRRVVCYFSAGTSEDWRPDFGDLPQQALGAPLPDWEGERWLDYRHEGVQEVMVGRLDQAVQKGCDGVEPDNVDGYTQNSGFELTAADQLAYNRWLANQAHERGLWVGLKNDGAQASDLVAYFDFSLNEQCHHYGECGALQPFLDAGKPIFNAEYPGGLTEAEVLASSLCPQAKSENIRTLILPELLDDSFRIACDEH